MKKTMKKAALIFTAAAAVALCAVMFTACGGSSAAITGVYLSPAQLSYSNMRPGYNYYTTAFTQQELTLFDDNTYCFIVSSSLFSAVELPAEGQDAKGNERTNYITKYFGEYTSAVNDLDADLLDVTLAVPTRIVSAYDSSYYLDTDNWTDAMGSEVVPGTIDTSTGAIVKDPNATPWTAEQYLESAAFTETKVQLNTKQYSFEFVTLTFPESE